MHIYIYIYIQEFKQKRYQFKSNSSLYYGKCKRRVILQFLCNIYIMIAKIANNISNIEELMAKEMYFSIQSVRIAFKYLISKFLKLLLNFTQY